MKISATAQGGFAGQGEHYEIDTSTNRLGAALEAALNSVNFFSAQAKGASPTGADLLHWTITVDDGVRHNTIRFCEDGTPGNAPWQRLLTQIRAAA